MRTPLTIDSADSVGLRSSIAVGDNGYPIISYYDATNADLKVAACTAADCTGTPTVTTIDSADDVGVHTSIAIGDNGYPVISYYDTTNADLKVAACTTADCTGTPTITIIDSADDVGWYLSIAIGNNGNPVISYHDVTNADLKVAACTAADCTGTPTVTIIDSTDGVGGYTSIAIGGNGNPVISYWDVTNDDLKVAACITADCSGTPTVTTIDSIGDVGTYTSIAIGDNGYPVISYQDLTNDDLKVAACITADCSGTPTVTTVDSDGDVGTYTSIAIGNNGYPVISYYDATNDDLKVAACSNADCSDTPTIATVDSDGDVGSYTSMAIGNNGNPVISYYDATNSALKMAAMWYLELPQ
jgi:20S proteasome alpha/beta subunit